MIALAPRVGRDAIPFADAAIPGRSLILHTYRPAAHRPADRVVVVQHGIRRNGDEYRDFWVDAAERYRLLIVAPTFDAAQFPEPENYNNGRVVDEAGAVRPREQWLYGIPARMLAALRAGGTTDRSQAWLFGHSAGGQFVHRLMALEAHDAFEAACPANSGWYTLPLLDRPYPEGLGGLGLGRDDLARYFGYPMAILAGDADVETAHEHLPRHPEALAQGPHRFARAHRFFETGRAEAARHGLPFRWEIVTVAGVAHDGAAMSRAAAERWFG